VFGINAMNRHLRIIAVFLALAAMGGLVLAGTHVHVEGSEHTNCWLCLSSVGSVAIQAIVSLYIFSWTCLGLSFVLPLGSHTQAVLSAPCSRAPPAVASI
jgi:hypothetical protein